VGGAVSKEDIRDGSRAVNLVEGAIFDEGRRKRGANARARSGDGMGDDTTEEGARRDDGENGEGEKVNGANEGLRVRGPRSWSGGCGARAKGFLGWATRFPGGAGCSLFSRRGARQQMMGAIVLSGADVGSEAGRFAGRGTRLISRETGSAAKSGKWCKPWSRDLTDFKLVDHESWLVILDKKMEGTPY